MTHAFPADTLDHLWRQARTLLADALHALRGPAEVLKVRTRRAYAAAMARLRLLESLVAKLLLIEAAQAPVPVPPSSSRHMTNHAVCIASSEHLTDATTWRVRFHVRLPPGAQPERARSAPRNPGKRRAHITQQKLRRLARRFEALRRVVADPRHAIAALARKLRALGRAAYEVARSIALTTPRCASPGKAHAAALVFAHDSCSAFRADTS